MPLLLPLKFWTCPCNLRSLGPGHGYKTIVKPKVFTNGTVQYDHLGLAMIREPKTLHEALHDKHWKGAMDEEFSALMKNKT
jgi:hypothetical protein